VNDEIVLHGVEKGAEVGMRLGSLLDEGRGGAERQGGDEALMRKMGRWQGRK